MAHLVLHPFRLVCYLSPDQSQKHSQQVIAVGFTFGFSQATVSGQGIEAWRTHYVTDVLNRDAAAFGPH